MRRSGNMQRSGKLRRQAARVGTCGLLAAALAAGVPGIGGAGNVFGDLAAGTILCAWAAETDGTQAASEVTSVEYANLRELILSGNFSLKQSQDSIANSVAPYEKMYQTLKEEQEYLEDMAESYEDDGDTELQELYENNAKSIRTSAAQINSTIKRMTGTSQTKAIEDMADSLTASAQNLMNSYNQMRLNVTAAEKSTEAAKAEYEAAEKKAAAGLIKDSELASAKNSYEKQKNSLASMQEQEAELKENLLTLLGLSGRTDLEIGEIPEPDLEKIRAVSVEADLQTAISNDDTWVSEVTSKVSGTDNRELRQERIAEAAGNAESSLRAAYTSLQTALASYEAAQSAYSAAKQDWDTVQKKQAAGLLSKIEYLQGEAAWLSGEAAMETASMNLTAAYESYCWLVEGVNA